MRRMPDQMLHLTRPSRLWRCASTRNPRISACPALAPGEGGWSLPVQKDSLSLRR